MLAQMLDNIQYLGAQGIDLDFEIAGAAVFAGVFIWGVVLSAIIRRSK